MNLSDNNTNTSSNNSETSLRQEIYKNDYTKIYRVAVPSEQRIIIYKTHTQSKYRYLIEREYEIGKQLCHPNVIRFQETMIVNNKDGSEQLCLIMENCEQGSLESYLRTCRHAIPHEELLKPWLRDIFASICYVHSVGLIHRDIKPHNFLVDERGRLKLADFGLAVRLDNETNFRNSAVGTTNYMAPEIVRKQKHDQAVDMWSLGALLYRIIVGRPPFYVEGEQPNQTKQRILTGKFEIPKAALDQCPTLCDIIRLLLVVNPEERLTCEDLLIMYPEYAIVPIDMDTTD